MYAIGCPSCIRIAPILFSEASILIVNSFLKLGKVSIGADTMACLSF